VSKILFSPLVRKYKNYFWLLVALFGAFVRRVALGEDDNGQDRIERTNQARVARVEGM
jgi:hypothetical protein